MKARLETVISNKVQMNLGLHQGVSESLVICLGTVISNKVQMNLGLHQGVSESLVIFTVIIELVLRDFIKSWKIRPRRLRGRSVSWKTMDKNIVVDGLAVLWVEPGICRVEGMFGRNCKIRDCTQICLSQQVFGEVETRSQESFV